MSEYQDASDQVDMLTRMADLFRRQRGGPQSQELARFFRTVEFSETERNGIWQAFDQLNTHYAKPGVLDLTRRFRIQQTDEVEPALRALDLRAINNYYRPDYDDSKELERLQRERHGLGRAIPDYLEWYAARPDNDAEKRQLINLSNRIRAFNRIVDLVRDR